jgi:hypothetical protein
LYPKDKIQHRTKIRTEAIIPIQTAAIQIRRRCLAFDTAKAGQEICPALCTFFTFLFIHQIFSICKRISDSSTNFKISMPHRIIADVRKLFAIHKVNGRLPKLIYPILF